jgi:class 3 adenylate cyclase
VVTGYTAISEFDAALLVDRDVVDVNDFALQALISIVNTFNSQNTGGIRVALIRANERPLSETFSPDDPCPRGLDICVELPGLGVAFRSDCRHCVRFRDNATDFAIAPVTRVNGVEGDAIQLSRASRLFQLPFTAAGDVERTTQPNDGSEVIARGFWLANYSCGVSVSHALNSERAAVDSSNATVGGASVVGLLTAGLLLSVTRYLLRGVETEWRMTKRRIAEDRRRFVSHVRDFMPEFLAPQMSKRFPAVWYAASAPLSVVFLEMCHMSEVYRTWQPTLLARFVSYQRIMLDSLLVEYSLHHVQMIGDQAFVIAGMDEDAEVVHHTFRAALFAASLHRLSNPAFAHFPGRCPALVKSFGTQVSSQFPDVAGAKEFVGCVKMPHYRVGIHLGECTTAVKPISGSPHFDVYGPAVGVALAIERKCHHGQILVSGAAKDAIEAHGGADVIYTRQGPLVTTQGKRRVATHVVSRARAPLPHAVMHELGIRPSVRSVDCLADDRSDTMTTSYAPSASTVDQ